MKKIKFGPILGKKETDSVKKVLRSGILAHGKKVEEFESLIMKYTKSKDAIAVSSCTAGMHLFYFVNGIGYGDEVIVPSQTHTATAHAIELTGAKAVFVDCVLETGNIDINLIEKKINKKTKAICVVHFIGIPVDMIKIMRLARKYKLKVIEDCATALGSKIKNKHVGLHGDAGVFSFYPVKHITTAEGGIIILKNKILSQKLRLARAFGINRGHLYRKKPGGYECISLGFNYRMSEVHAAIGVSQIKKFEKFLKIRSKNFFYFKKLFEKEKKIQILESNSKNLTSSYYCFQILLKNKVFKFRDEIILFLKKRGVGTSVYYPKPVPKMKYYKEKYKAVKNQYKNAEIISKGSISIPIHPGINFTDINYIYSLIKQFLKRL